VRPGGRTVATMGSPVARMQALMASHGGRPDVLDLSQGAPNYMPPPGIVDRIRSAVLEPAGHSYATRPGLPTLRALIAQDLSLVCSGDVGAEDVLVTAGCNQAFCVALNALCEEGDHVVLLTPHYFNHSMWLEMEGIEITYVDTAPSFGVDVSAVEAALTGRTRAVIAVSPGNPTGSEIPTDVLGGLLALCQMNGIALVLDETYKAFRSSATREHQLFAQSQWRSGLVSLHSFSKEFAIPGHRVGAVVADPVLVREMGKIVDCMSVCAPRLGQEAAIAGLSSEQGWRRRQADVVAARRDCFAAEFLVNPGGLEVVSIGGFFAWLRYKAPLSSEVVCESLLVEAGVAALPGSAFYKGPDQYLRMSYANTELADIAEVRRRLQNFDLEAGTQ
jgi:aspartate/methionine/tyrosine aminotransferase